MDMFIHYDNQGLQEKPNNLVQFLDIQELEYDAITLGATNTHYFSLPVDVADIKDYKVSYKQGLSIVLEKSYGDCELEALGDGVFLKVILEPTESRLFNFYNKDTTVQLAIKLADDQVIHSELYRLKIIDSINNKAFEQEIE